MLVILSTTDLIPLAIGVPRDGSIGTAGQSVDGFST